MGLVSPIITPIASIAPVKAPNTRTRRTACAAADGNEVRITRVPKTLATTHAAVAMPSPAQTAKSKYGELPRYKVTPR